MEPLDFFTNAADRLLKAYTAQWAVIYYTNDDGTLLVTNNPSFVATFNGTNAFGVTDIPVLISNQFVYTPAVNRLLQLAANMYRRDDDQSLSGHLPPGLLTWFWRTATRMSISAATRTRTA